MSTLEDLKEYFISDDGYLLNDDNNGKTVMLSGAWGSGKTHFWQNEIVREQIKIQGKTRKVNKYSAKEYKEGLFSILQKKKKACVYISLYGKDNIEDIKSQVFAQAYAQIPKKGNKDKNIDKSLEWLGYGSKIASAVSIFGVKIDTTEIIDKGKDYQDSEKLSQAQEAIKDGGVICFDDFERKSKHIDLNDLFGVITQLSLEFNCKVVIILNSDVFEGEEANVFKTVKEKTVNKYFHFEPTPKELFDSVSKDKKYNKLNDHKKEILKAIEETEELNARIYIQVLDNCLEWIDKGYGDDEEILRVLVLNTICFAKYHFLLEQTKRLPQDTKDSYPLYKIINEYPSPIFDFFETISNLSSNKIAHISFKQDLFALRSWITQKNSETKFKYNESVHDKYLLWIDEKENELKAIYKYGYKLYNFKSIDTRIENKLMLFIKSGILLKKEENS